MRPPFMVYATVCLTVVPSFSDITDVSTIGHSSKTDRSRTPLFHVAQYEDDIIGRELNLRQLSGRQWDLQVQECVFFNIPTCKVTLRMCCIRVLLHGGKFAISTLSEGVMRFCLAYSSFIRTRRRSSTWDTLDARPHIEHV